MAVIIRVGEENSAVSFTEETTTVEITGCISDYAGVVIRYSF